MTSSTTQFGHLTFTRDRALTRQPLLDPTIGLPADIRPVLVLVSWPADSSQLSWASQAGTRRIVDTTTLGWYREKPA